MGERIRIVTAFAKKIGVTILLKGPTDIITDGKQVRFCSLGNSRMTVAGTGDVLAGLCAGFLAQNGDPFISACAASFTNKHAGDTCLDEKGPTYFASELIDQIPKIIKKAIR